MVISLIGGDGHFRILLHTISLISDIPRGETGAKQWFSHHKASVCTSTTVILLFCLSVLSVQILAACWKNPCLAPMFHYYWETIQVLEMWQDLWVVNWKYAGNNSNWWKTIQLLKMWRDIWAVNLKYAWNNTQWWKTMQLLKMWPDIWAFVFPAYFKLPIQMSCHILSTGMVPQ